MTVTTRRVLALLAGVGLYAALLDDDLGILGHLQLVAVGLGMVWVLRGSFGWGGTLVMQTLFSPAVYVVSTLIVGILAGRLGESLHAAAWVYLPAIPRLAAVGLVAYAASARAGRPEPEAAP